MNVSNRKCIRRLSIKSMMAARSRNIIAVIAIALTSILFTTLFTIAMSINHSIQQANFRQVGGYSHGSFKYLTWEQSQDLKGDPLIKEYGLRLFVGMPFDLPFNKSHVEVSYCDENAAKWMFIDPAEGRLPAEGTNEAATDLRVLSLLGIEPRLGTEFNMTFDVDGQETTEVFTLCGWWEYDNAVTASHVLLPESRAHEIFEKLGTQGNDGMTGFWVMDIMLSGDMRIERDILTILDNHGYHSFDRHEANYIAIGVNWGYTGAQLFNAMDFGTLLAIAALLLIIVFTGYLIIYNVFQISITNDIRYYGLLKTIGVTARQLKRMIRIQAFSLSALGIPIGLLAGYFLGVRLTPVVLSNLNGVVMDAVSASPLIFLFAALFSLLTILISCRKPGKMAARISPIEAERYSERGREKKSLRNSQKPASLSKMALANLGRNRRKTIVTLISLSMSVVLLNLIFTFSNGFDMDKYLANLGPNSDFMLADAGYFQVGGDLWNANMAVSEDVIENLEKQHGITAGGRTYGLTSSVQEFVTEDYYRRQWGRLNPPETVDSMVNASDKLHGRLADNAQLYGMERFVLDKLTVMDGDITKLYEPGGRYVAAVYMEDDYGNAHPESHWAAIGDKITLRYVERWEYYNPDTGEVFDEEPDQEAYRMRAKEYRDVEYEVAALVSIPHALGYRYYGSDEFVMNDQTFIQDTGTNEIMYYVCDTVDENTGIEAYLRDFTENRQPQYDYESKETYAAEFESFRRMFTMLGGVLCFILGLVGMLNFLNSALTSIITRRREFAVLQAIGMTSKQLKTMLVWEGIAYTLGSVAASLLLCVVTAPLLSSALGDMFWFFSYHFTIAPVLTTIPVFVLLGVLLPLISYRFANRQSVVERLRDAQG